MAPKLIVSDIDGTFINSADRVTDRLRGVVGRAVSKGARVALATGRPHLWIAPVLEQLPIRPICVAANGAVLFDSATGQILDTHELDPQVMAEIITAARRGIARITSVPTSIAVERSGQSGKEGFVASTGYVHTWDAPDCRIGEEAEVISEPAVKLLVRNEGLSAAEMYAALRDEIDPEIAHVTYSMTAGLLEFAAPGVSKQTGVEKLCERYGIAQSDVICFGDMPNDIEMITAAGRGIAMGNAADVVKAAANETTATNDEGGVAEVLERWF